MPYARGARSAGSLPLLVMLLFIVFLVLRLTNEIDWSWWWVTSPLWLSALAFVAFAAVGGGIALIVYGVIKRRRRKRRSEREGL